MNEGRVVVFRPGALGDTIVTADALAALRRRFSGRMIELVGNAPAAGLLRDSGLIDVATSFDSLEVADLFVRTPSVAPRWRDAELVVLWLADAEAIAEAFRAAGAREVVVAAPPLFAATAARDGPHPIHISDYLVQTLAGAGVLPLGSGPTLLEPPAVARISRAACEAVLHPGSGSPSKNWPAERFAEIARRLIEREWTVRLLSGPADGEAIGAVHDALGGQHMLVEQPRDVVALADMLAAASLYVGNDSGVSHLSGRLGVPTVAVFGSTDPRRWAPRGPRVSLVDGLGSWPTVDQVWDAALRFTKQADEDEPREPGAMGLGGRASPGGTPRRTERPARES